MNPRNFFSELKRRNVYRVAAAYGVIAWLLIQAASILFPTFEAPGWVMKAFIVAIVLGFPVALLLAWAFELTPQGVKRTEEVSPGQSIARSTGPKLDFAIMGVLALAVALLLFDRFRPKRQTHASGIVDKSVAVLPFENLSEDKANAYFAHGIQDEIVTRLAKIGGLKVISRSSTDRYESAPKNLVQVARELGVENLLQGSIQKHADQVRVNVRLVNALSNDHLWAETYDRTLTNIFAVETEIAQHVADTLKVQLTGEEKTSIATKPTANAAAYDAYLRGLALTSSYRDSPLSLNSQVEYFRQAAEADPGFALAWARLAKIHMRVYFLGYDRSRERIRAAKEAMEKASTLQPNLGEASLAVGFYHIWLESDEDAAIAAFRKAQLQSPGNAEVLEALAYAERRRGNWSKVFEYHREAAQINPRDVRAWAQFAVSYLTNRQFSEAHKMVQRALEVVPDHPPTLTLLARIHVVQGDLERGLEVVRPLPPMPDYPYTFWMQVRILLFAQRYDEAARILESVLQQPRPELGYHMAQYRYLLGLARQLAGQTEAAAASLREAVEELEQFRQIQPDDPTVMVYLAFAHAAAGEKEAALANIRAPALQNLAGHAFRGSANQEALARVLAQVGEHEAALTEIRRLLSANYLGPESIPLTPAMLRLEPMWEPLRADPRFQELAATQQP